MQKQLHKLQGHRHHLMENSDGSDEEEDEDDDEEMTRDEFNLNKMIVIVTSAGKVRSFKWWREVTLSDIKSVSWERKGNNCWNCKQVFISYIC